MSKLFCFWTQTEYPKNQKPKTNKYCVDIALATLKCAINQHLKFASTKRIVKNGKTVNENSNGRIH